MDLPLCVPQIDTWASDISFYVVFNKKHSISIAHIWNGSQFWKQIIKAEHMEVLKQNLLGEKTVDQGYFATLKI